jgi:hypothetical protein
MARITLLELDLSHNAAPALMSTLEEYGEYNRVGDHFYVSDVISGVEPEPGWSLNEAFLL